MAVDGNTGTRWSSGFSDPQWIQVGLGASAPISRVRLNWEAAFASAYAVQTSANGSSWTDSYVTAAGDGGLDDLNVAATARYVRVYGTQRATPYGYSLWELEVYGGCGTPTSTPTVPPGGRDAFGTVEAESSNGQSGTSVQAATDTGGGQNVTGIGNGDWLRFDGVNFGSQTARSPDRLIA